MKQCFFLKNFNEVFYLDLKLKTQMCRKLNVAYNYFLTFISKTKNLEVIKNWNFR